MICWLLVKVPAVRGYVIFILWIAIIVLYVICTLSCVGALYVRTSCVTFALSCVGALYARTSCILYSNYCWRKPTVERLTNLYWAFCKCCPCVLSVSVVYILYACDVYMFFESILVKLVGFLSMVYIIHIHHISLDFNYRHGLY